MLGFDIYDKQKELLKEYAEILLRRSLETNLIGHLEKDRLRERNLQESIS